MVCSRLMIKITSDNHKNKAGIIKELLAVYKSHEDLISIGAYATGSNPKVDAAIMLKDSLDNFLRQGIEEMFSFNETISEIDDIINSLYSQEEEVENKNLIFE